MNIYDKTEQAIKQAIIDAKIDGLSENNVYLTGEFPAAVFPLVTIDTDSVDYEQATSAYDRAEHKIQVVVFARGYMQRKFWLEVQKLAMKVKAALMDRNNENMREVFDGGWRIDKITLGQGALFRDNTIKSKIVYTAALNFYGKTIKNWEA